MNGKYYYLEKVENNDYNELWFVYNYFQKKSKINYVIVKLHNIYYLHNKSKTNLGFHYKSFIKSFKNKTNIYFNVIEEVLIYLDQKKDNYLNNLEVIRSNNYNSIKSDNNWIIYNKKDIYFDKPLFIIEELINKDKYDYIFIKKIYKSYYISIKKMNYCTIHDVLLYIEYIIKNNNSFKNYKKNLKNVYLSKC